MILDNLLTVSGAISAAGVISGQLVTSLGNTVSTNTIDLANATSNNQTSDFGQGTELEIEISILQTLTSGGAATVQFQLIQATDAALTTSIDVINQTDAIAFATLTAGTLVALHWDRAAPLAPKRYIGVRYVVGTAALTNGTGQFFASVGKNIQDVRNIYLRSGFSIS